MKSLVFAAGLLGLTATTAMADRWDYPYERRHHAFCQEKARDLHRYEHRATADRHLTKRELVIIEALRRDLDRTCRGWRWKG